MLKSHKPQEHLRCHLNLLFSVLGFLTFLGDGLCRSTPATFSNFLLGCASILHCPVAGLVLEFGGVADQHASDFCVLWIFWFGCGEEGLERDKGGLDSKDWRPL